MTKDTYRELIQRMSPFDIWLDIDAITSSGISIDEVLDLGEPRLLYFADHYQKILDLGADPMHLFKLNEWWYKMHVDWPEDLIDILNTYIDHGLDREFAKNWLKKHIIPAQIIDHAAALKQFFNPRDYLWCWLECNAARAITKINSLPDYVTPDDVVKHFTVSEIKAYISGYADGYYLGYGVFVRDFLSAGGDLELIAEKTIKELGYPENEDDLMALALIASHGAKAINANKIVDALTLKAYYYIDPDSIRVVNFWFYEMLGGLLDEAHKQKLRN